MFDPTYAFSGFSVKDMQAAKSFYTDKLGLKIDGEGVELKLHLPGGATVFMYAKPDHQPATYTMLNFSVADIDEAVDELIKRGVVFERYDNMPAPQDDKGILRGLKAGMGPDIAWFKDPSGNILSVLQEK
ncbi:MAG TPA: VOC family protein [Bacillota bacterium]|nr:VOC family protein [Bacillota bacterium]